MSSPQFPQQQFYEHGAGAYGRDGAPPSNFMSSPPYAHRLPSPQRPNIASSERPLAPPDRFSPSSSPNNRTPPTHSNPFSSPYDPTPSPPKAAFLEPAPVTDHNYDCRPPRGLIHGESEKCSIKEEFYRPMACLDDLRGTKSEENSSAWLKKQSHAGSKFKTATWVAAIALIIILACILAKIISTKSSPVTSPTPLKWANGASAVPTFGQNDPKTNQPQTTSSNQYPKPSVSPSTTSRQRRSLNFLD